MRFGWLVAAAAIVVSAGQASAGRYFEFKVSGSAIAPNYVGDPMSSTSFRDFIFTDTTDVFIDTADLAVGQSQLFTVLNSATSAAMLVVTRGDTTFELRATGGPVYDLTVNTADISSGEAVQQLGGITSNFGLSPCYGRNCATTIYAGNLDGVYARTTDVVPQSLQASVSQVSSVLPEPASWALMILGFAFAGSALRRDNRRARTALFA